MEKQKRILLNCLIGLFIMVFIYILVKFYPVYKIIFIFIGKLLLPFIIASFVSYIIYPLLLWLQKYRIKRGLSILMIYLLFFGSLLFLLYKSIPVFIFELQELSKQLPQMIQQYEQMMYQLYDSTAFLPEVVHDKMDNLILHIESIIDKRINGVLNKVENITDFIVLLALTPVLVFYFLKDYISIKKWLKQLIPSIYHRRFERVLKAIDESLGGYLRGQVIISSIIIFVTYLVYYLVDLKYALLLAIFMGVMNIIPYFGPIIGTIPAALIALTTSMKLLIIILITNMLVQLLESSFLSPYIMGKNVQIHPIILIFTLLLGAEFGGIVGMIIAVPVVTIIRAIYTQLRMESQHSH